MQSHSRFARGHSARGFSLHQLWHAMGGRGPRGAGGPFSGGPSGFGGGFGGGGFGGFGGDDERMTRGRKFTAADLQLMLLVLIEEQPSHGYELIKALETRTNGFYVPSPGMVYPALTYLEELGYVTVQLEGNRKRYELADLGREHLVANREHVDLMFAKLKHIARKMDYVRRAYAGEEQLHVSEGGWLPELIAARHAVKHALVRTTDASEAEQRRIAAILQQAAADILAEPPKSEG